MSILEYSKSYESDFLNTILLSLKLGFCYTSKKCGIKVARRHSNVVSSLIIIQSTSATRRICEYLRRRQTIYATLIIIFIKVKLSQTINALLSESPRNRIDEQVNLSLHLKKETTMFEYTYTATDPVASYYGMHAEQQCC